MRHRIIFLIILGFLPVAIVFSQETQLVDSMVKKYQAETDPKQKALIAGKLTLTYNSINPAVADSFGKLCLKYAEYSRDRKTMVKAYSYIGEKFLHRTQRKENIEKSLGYYQQAYNLARESKLDEEMISTLLKMAYLQLIVPDADRAMNYTSQAFALISDKQAYDSLKARCFISYGNVYLVKKEKLLSLRNYLNAQRLAEQLKDYTLQRDVFLKLSQFYASVKNYDKAIDYAVLASEKIDPALVFGAPYLRFEDLTYQGRLFIAKKQYELAQAKYDEALKLGDSLNSTPLKVQAYLFTIDLYLSSNKPAEALRYFNSRPEISKFINLVGMGGAIDHINAYAYMEMNKMDSAAFYYNKAQPFYNALSSQVKLIYSDHYFEFLKKTGQHDKAINLLSELAAIAKNNSDLEWQQKIYKNLDSSYQKLGDFRQAMFYSGLSQQLKDTLQQLAREEDILQLQLQDEDERRERAAKLEQEERKRRHQYQYLGITIAIAVSIVLLIMLGAFKVSKPAIRIIGFFTFIMLFEFVFLLLKINLYPITEGEPWKDLVAMIVLAACLLPLHHWIEHKVIHYLTNKQLIKVDPKKQFARLLRKQVKSNETVESV